MNTRTPGLLFPDPPRGLWPEQAGRWVLAGALTVLFLGFHAISAGSQPRPGWAAFSALLFLLLGMVAALLIQGGRPANALLVAGGTVAAAAGLFLNAGLVTLTPAFSGSIAMLSALLAAVSLGTWAARWLRTPAEWLAVILCAAVGDAWLTVLNVTQGVAEGHPLVWLRMDVLTGPANRMAPVFVDLFFVALFLESGRRLGLRVTLLMFGALTGYAGAEVISLTTWQAMPALPLVGLGVLAGSWAELRCTPREVLKGLVVSLVLFALLLGSVFVRRALHPPPQRKPEFFMPRDMADRSGCGTANRVVALGYSRGPCSLRPSRQAGGQTGSSGCC